MESNNSAKFGSNQIGGDVSRQWWNIVKTTTTRSVIFFVSRDRAVVKSLDRFLRKKAQKMRNDAHFFLLLGVGLIRGAILTQNGSKDAEWNRLHHKKSHVRFGDLIVCVLFTPKMSKTPSMSTFNTVHAKQNTVNFNLKCRVYFAYGKLLAQKSKIQKPKMAAIDSVDSSMCFEMPPTSGLSVCHVGNTRLI